MYVGVFVVADYSASCSAPGTGYSNWYMGSCQVGYFTPVGGTCSLPPPPPPSPWPPAPPQQTFSTLVSSGLTSPTGVATDVSGNIYIADTFNHVIKKYASDGTLLLTIGRGTGAGGSWGSGAYMDGVATTAQFNCPTGVTVAPDGTLFVADNRNCVIRRVTSLGTVSTYAGVAGSCSFTDGTSTQARFMEPFGVALDTGGNLYVADTSACAVRMIAPAATVVSTLAGSAGCGGIVDGPASSATFKLPMDLVFNPADGFVYVADQDNGAIRKVAPNGTVFTLARGMSTLSGIDVDSSGRFYVSQRDANQVTVVTTGGNVYGLAASSSPMGVALTQAGDVLYVISSSLGDLQKIILRSV